MSGKSSHPDAGFAADWRPNGRVREYWLQVESYANEAAPSHRDGLMGQPITVPTAYVGLRYRAFTPNWDEPLPASAEHGPNDGVPGPILRAEVGDLLRVHLRNADMHYAQPHSLHPHGVFYDPDSDGSWTAVRPDMPGGGVQPGATYTYEWQARCSSVGAWAYHDHSIMFGLARDGSVVSAASSHQHDMGVPNGPVRLDREVVPEAAIPNGLANSLGLIGMIIITEPGAARPDREFFIAMHEIHKFDVPGLWPDPAKGPEVNEQLFCVNGRTGLGNTPEFRARVGEHVRWHVVALGNVFRSFRIDGRRCWDGTRYNDRLFLNSAETRVIDYVERQPGTWLYGDYIHARYRHAIGRYVVEA